MIEIEIDGKTVAVPDGATVMDAANRADVYIPHFCYHKKLSIAANCRMCLVQVEKANKPLPACATPVTAGMRVFTRSAKAIDAQKGVMEFLLINHPLDCPICDQGGECQLQDIAVGYGGSGSRYQEEKRVVVNKNLGALVSTDMTRCINCTRCVRFTEEIAGKLELGQAFRGEHAEIMPFLEKTVDSELSGNIIDLCPVGALTSKPFRYAARTWELSRRRSVSPHDSLGSNLIVQTKHDKVLRVLPFENEAINECWLSDKDRFSYLGLDAADRLTVPRIKRDGQWIDVSWQEALDVAAGLLKGVIADHGPDALGLAGSPHATLEELYLLKQLGKELDCGNVDFRLRQRDFRADAQRSGAPWLGMTLADVAELDRLLVVGSNLRKDVPLLAQRVRQATRRGLKVSVVNAAFDDWALPVAAHVTVAPSAMASALESIVVALASVKDVSPDASVLPDYSSVTPDVEAEALAALLARGRQVAVWLGNAGEQAADAARLAQLCGEIARLSGGCFGVIGEAANSVGGYLAGATPAEGALNAFEMFAQPRKAYLMMGFEPALDVADPRQAMTALRSATAVVALTPFAGASICEVADVMLPVAPFTETSGTFVNCEGTAQSFVAVVRPAGEARPAWKVLRVLGNVLELDGFGYESSTDVSQQALGEGDLSALLGNGIRGTLSAVPVAEANASTLERFAEVPIYAADPLVRRSAALQKTADASPPVARIAPQTIARLGLEAGDRVSLGRAEAGDAVCNLLLVADETLAENCVRVIAAHADTAGLGAFGGAIRVERI